MEQSPKAAVRAQAVSSGVRLSQPPACLCFPSGPQLLRHLEQVQPCLQVPAEVSPMAPGEATPGTPPLCFCGPSCAKLHPQWRENAAPGLPGSVSWPG